MKSTPWIAGTVMALTMLLVAGCGDGRPKRVPVSGTVTIDGKPVEHGYVRLFPHGNRAATGTLGPGGRFTLGSFDAADGVVPGTHRAIVVATERMGGLKVRWHAPRKYSELETSGLEVTIDGPTNDLKIELTGPDGQFTPFIEGDEEIVE